MILNILSTSCLTSNLSGLLNIFISSIFFPPSKSARMFFTIPSISFCFINSLKMYLQRINQCGQSAGRFSDRQRINQRTVPLIAVPMITKYRDIIAYHRISVKDKITYRTRFAYFYCITSLQYNQEKAVL